MGDPVCHLHLLDEEGRMPEPRVRLRRVYDVPPSRPPGERRILVDRVWPRGVRKDEPTSSPSCSSGGWGCAA